MLDPLDTSISRLGTRPPGRVNYTAISVVSGFGYPARDQRRVGVINAHVIEVERVAASTLETEPHSGAGADEVRIEAQAEVFKSVLPHYHMKVVLPEGADNPSAAVNWEHGEDVLLTGIFDAVILWDGVPAIMDLKLTGSLVSRWGPNGKPGWGDYFNMDHIQAYLYMYLAEKIFKRKMRFVYALFEYGPDPRFKFLEIKDSSMHRAEMMNRLDGARDKLLEMKAQNYPRQGHYRQCTKCAEKDTVSAIL